MPDSQDIILGEFRCKLDERFRLSVPGPLCEPLLARSADCMLAKERAGCLSLWNADIWQAKLGVRIGLARQKIEAGLHDSEIGQVQLLGRLLSTGQAEVKLAGRGRLLIPPEFRKFLGVEPKGAVMVVGAAVCVEIWHPTAWLKYLEGRMPKFRRLVAKLS